MGVLVIVGFSGTEKGDFDKQAGATGLLASKRLLDLASRIVGTVASAGLSCLYTGSTHVVKHPIRLVRVLVMVGGLLARVWSLVKLHAYVVVLEELN